MKPSELIRQRGWCQGTFENYYGCLCVSAAQQRSDIRSWQREWKVFEEHIRSAGFNGVITWNDRPDRTAEEVIAKLEEFGL